MRTIFLASALTIALGGTAVAQMCGGGMQQQTSTTAQTGGMSCMGMMQQAQANDPMAEKSDKPMMSGGMCPCCKNMAMMGGMKQDAQPKQDMPMTPKQ